MLRGMTTAPPTPGAFPPLAPTPSAGSGWAVIEPWLRCGFKALNRVMMVPIHRAGLGAWLGTPVGGYMLLLRVRGRRSGLVREVPLSYLVADGAPWVMAGFGSRTQWFRNLLADPEVEVRLPGRTLRCRAEEARDPTVRARILPALTRAAGVPGTMIGCNPWAAPDERILELLSWIPLVRLTPVDGPVAAGPDDPGGHAWIWRQAVVLGLTVWLLRACRPGGARR